MSSKRIKRGVRYGTLPVSGGGSTPVIPLDVRILEDGVTYRILEDGLTYRIIETGPPAPALALEATEYLLLENNTYLLLE